MYKATEDGTQAALLRELEAPGFVGLLAGLREVNERYRQFASWADAIAFMHGRSADDPANDDVLRPIIAAHTCDGDPRWRHVLMAIFWPGLVSLQRRLGRMEPSGSDCAQDVDVMFIEVLMRLNLARRSKRLLQLILNTTYRRLYKSYQRRHRLMGREIPTDPDSVVDMAGTYEVAFDLFERRDRDARRAAHYQRFADRGVISPQDARLLVDTRVYGLTVDEYAQKTGQCRDVLRKRRQRAEAVISCFCKDFHDSCPALTPK